MTSDLLPMTGRQLFAMLAVIAFAVIGCGGSDPAQTGDATTTSAAPSVGVAEVEAAEGSGSPIDQLLGVPIMDDAAMNDYAIELLTEGERETATCMIAAGFEYTPIVPGNVALAAPEGTSDRERAEQQGFGIVDGFKAATWDGAAQTQDRNAVYLASLAEAEREAYFVALYGSPEDEQSDGGPADEDGVGEDSGIGLGFGGCKALAAASLANLFGVLEQFDAPANNIFDQFEADPRMVESSENWSRCLADLGYTASDPDEVRQLVYERLIPIIDNNEAYDIPPGVEEPENVEFADLADWSFLLSGDGWGVHPPLTTEAQAQVDEVAEFERELAVAHFDCHEPLREAELAIQREYEQKLVDEIGPAVLAALESD